ncbi:MAG: hypothetical protein QXI77_03495, partial [Nanopusillaceae archaeon]
STYSFEDVYDLAFSLAENIQISKPRAKLYIDHEIYGPMVVTVHPDLVPFANPLQDTTKNEKVFPIVSAFVLGIPLLMIATAIITNAPMILFLSGATLYSLSYLAFGGEIPFYVNIVVGIVFIGAILWIYLQKRI